MKKKILMITGVLVLVIIVLWFLGIIPKQIGIIYGTKYMKDNFPEMQLKFVNIEWSKYHGDYIISFKNKEKASYSCVIGPKYFPINIGQGLNTIIETYQEKYASNKTTSYIPEGINIVDENNDNIPTVDKEYNREPKNVNIKVLTETITNTSVEILITDNNVDQYGWGVEFRVQKKNNDNWEELKYISEDLGWIEIAYELDENKQLTEKLNIEKYYGKLSSGIYRIVKPVYDNGYIDIYSNEFEIK